jgi:hypothetical protein
MAVHHLIVLFCILFNSFAVGKVNVHIVSHTHDDVGWLKTVDQYYYGANNSIQRAGVQYILDTVIRELYDYPYRKFTYVEQAFFQRWWREQDSNMQMMVKKVLERGQLEWANGGWCMHDEAATHYIAMVDQTTVGHRHLKREFGAQGLPRVTWQIDPFGHSSTQAALLSARAGFEGLYFARIDYQDNEVRHRHRDLETIWRPSPSLGKTGQVFTGVFPYSTYCPPGGFDWDDLSNNEPVQDDTKLENNNVKHIVHEFVRMCQDVHTMYRGEDIMLTMGCDFEYSNARTWFKNLDKLIKFVNADGRVNVFYSTPGAYNEAKLKSNISFSVKTDDFFPYADCPHCYWTGYFTSRAALKRYVRINSAYLNAARQLAVFGGGSLSPLFEEAMGLAQHHDAVSGTSKQHVAYDYATHMAKGVAEADQLTGDAMKRMLHMPGAPLDAKGEVASLISCHLMNESYCPFTQQNNNFKVVFYNPTSKATTELVRVPVSGKSYSVYNASSGLVPSQVAVSFSPFPKGVSPAPFVLYFVVKIGPMETLTYSVQRQSEAQKSPKKSRASGVIANNAVQVSYATDSGKITGILNLKTGVSLPVAQDLLYYKALQNSDQNSGAYIFRPTSTQAYQICSGTPVTVSVVQGPVVSEIRTTCGTFVAQTVRIVQDSEFVEFEYQVGTIPVSDGQGKEIVTRFSSSIKSNKTWYTDSNGREYQTRILNYRPTWNLTVNEPVAGNYYPVNVGIYLKDAATQLSILTDRSLGGASLNDGQVELMIQRRLLQDDGRGVGEPLNETDGITPYDNNGNGGVRIGTGIHVTGTHRVLVDSATNSYSMRKIRIEQNKFFSPIVTKFTASSALPSDRYLTKSSFLAGPALPPNVEIMTLQRLDNNQYLLRLAHQFAVGEDSTYSQPVTVDINGLFSFPIKNIKEVSLTTNRDASEMPQFNPINGDHFGANSDTLKIIPFNGVQAVINPMDIRTFTFEKA